MGVRKSINNTTHEEKKGKITKTIEAKKNKDNGFAPQSNYPSKEYINYLQWRIDNLIILLEKEKSERKKNILKKDIEGLYNLIKHINKNSVGYRIMDLIFAGESEKAKNTYPINLYEQNVENFKNLVGLAGIIYESFSSEYGLVNKDKEKNKNVKGI